MNSIDSFRKFPPRRAIELELSWRHDRKAFAAYPDVLALLEGLRNCLATGDGEGAQLGEKMAAGRLRVALMADYGAGWLHSNEWKAWKARKPLEAGPQRTETGGAGSIFERLQQARKQVIDGKG